jgi:heme A synthase
MDRLTRFAWGVLAYNVVVVLWGSVVRATGSGAGCGNHWPLCNGEVVPSAPALATVIEFSHRLTTGLAGILVVALLVAAFRARPARHPARSAAAWSLAFIVVEAAIGAGLVKFDLVADNQSLARGFSMATHLVNTFLLLAALALTAHYAGGAARAQVAGRSREASLLGLGLLAVLLASASGAVAALGDTLFPARSLAEALQADVSPAAHILVRLRVLHPFLALATAAYLVSLSFLVRRGGSPVLARLLAGLALAQTALGGLNVLLLAPVWMQVAHLLLADLVWIVLVLFAARVLSSEDLVAAPAVAVASRVLSAGAR